MNEPFISVYTELRQLAAAKLKHEPSGHTLDATALVHEVWLKLGTESFASSAGFFRAAAVAMQRILVDHARGKRAEKRGGDGKRLMLADSDRLYQPDPETVLAVNEAIESLAAEDADAAALARLRLFAGMTVEEAADALSVSRATAFRDWAFARAWLTAALRDESHS